MSQSAREFKGARPAIKITLFISLFLFGAVYGNKVSIEKISSFMEGLKSSTSIIFGVVAAWIALVYPEELKAKIGNENTSELKSARLFKAFYVSSGALLVAISLQLYALVAESAGLKFSGRVGLGVCLFASGLQLWALKLVVFATEHMRTESEILGRRVRGAKRLLGRYD